MTAGGSNGPLPPRRAGGSPWSSSPWSSSPWSSSRGLPLTGLGLEEGAPPPRADPQGRVPARNKMPIKTPVQSGPELGRGGDAGLHTSRPLNATEEYPASAHTSPVSPAEFLPPSLSNGLRDLYLQGAGGPAGPGPRGQRSVRETPVRDEEESDWRAAGGPEGGHLEVGGRPAPGRHQGEELGRTVYNKLAKRLLSVVPSAKRTCREPTPGSEVPGSGVPGSGVPGSEVPGGGQPGTAVFSALRQCQQDSGFHSPFSPHQ